MAQKKILTSKRKAQNRSVRKGKGIQSKSNKKDEKRLIQKARAALQKRYERDEFLSTHPTTSFQSEAISTLIDEGKMELDKFEKRVEQERGSTAQGTKASSKYKKALADAIRACDVLYEVLDCRNPLAYRNESLEQEIAKQKKKLVYVLNKIDLVPLENALAWKKMLTTPDTQCVLFKASQVAHSISVKVSDVKRTKASSKYKKALADAIRACDVLYEVLDCRNPLAYRNESLEQEIAKQKKKLVYVLNKIDLVPLENALAWKKMLTTPDTQCVLFKASQVAHSISVKVSDVKRLGKAHSVGVKDLITAATKGRGGMKTIAGVCGFPNVGKSSIIFTLSRGKKGISIASKAGQTTTQALFDVSDRLSIIDTPGIDFSRHDEAELVLMGVKTEAVHDYEVPVKRIVSRCSKEAIGRGIGIPAWWKDEAGRDIVGSDSQVAPHLKLIYEVAKKRNMYKHGGKYDVEKACKYIVDMFTEGKIMHFVDPEEAMSRHKEKKEEEE
ncbi:hypothetical protein ADUPG1_010574 [Aduncisulcus paluster]|uniref:G domain-containing protein n=1 Tax=Aduncisulcus paluster TaxID=2918883 RepID=A0ABQ5JW33_9EUKA|nr:hypothetical protein ADUPG1_010574 [Aduncisulcus paluster]